MNSNILNSIGLGKMDPAIPFMVVLGFCLILLVLLIILMVKQKKITKRYEKFMQGKDAKSLEDEFAALFEDLKFLKNASDKNQKDIKKLYQLQEKDISKIALKKYDAFQQMGGQLSYVIALLDETNSGIIMNSVHSTDGCYSYVKEIKNGECFLPLGEEEVETLQTAMNK